jgi:hypothetical protein
MHFFILETQLRVVIDYCLTSSTCEVHNINDANSVLAIFLKTIIQGSFLRRAIYNSPVIYRVTRGNQS